MHVHESEEKIYFPFKSQWEMAHTEIFSWEKINDKKTPTLTVFKSNLNYFLRKTYDDECQLSDTRMFSIIKPHSATYGRFI